MSFSYLGYIEAGRPERCAKIFVAPAFFLLCFSSHAISFAETPSPRPSHFVELVEPLVNLPAGAQLDQLTELLSKKIRLRRDLPAEALPFADLQPGLFAATRLPAASSILRQQVTDGIPASLAAFVPPHAKLHTLVIEMTDVPDLTLCEPYDKVLVKLKEGGRQVEEDEAVETSAVSYEQNLAINNRPLSAIVVLAVKPDAEVKLTALLKRTGEIVLRCLRSAKY